MTEPNDLIDRKMIAAAQAAHEAVAARLAQSRQDGVAATAAHRAAGAASEAALASGGNAIAAELDLEAAERGARVATKVRAAAEAAHAESAGTLAEAIKQAHAGVLKAAVLRRVAAVRKAHELTTALQQCGQDYMAAGQVISECHGHIGLVNPTAMQIGHSLFDNSGKPISPELHESYLVGCNVDVATGRMSWMKA